MSTIYIIRDAQAAGPFSEDDIRAQLDRGELTLADYAWREGMADWQPLAELVALPTEPPPPPPAPAPVEVAPPEPTVKSRAPRKRHRVTPAFTMAGVTEFLEVFPDRLTITPKGGQALRGRRAAGIREVSLALLLDIGYKLPSFTSGYLQFGFSGETGGLSRAPGDLNTFRFIKSSDNVDAAGRITAYVQERIREIRAVPQYLSATGLSDEIGKLATLRAQGALTDAEFHAAKQRLLT